MEYIFIVLIINNRYVRWEEIKFDATLRDLFFY